MDQIAPGVRQWRAAWVFLALALGLHVADEALTGFLPVGLGNLTELSYLGLDSNRLSGPIPSELGNATGLYTLLLSSNMLSGPVPASIMNLTHLSGGLGVRYNALYAADPAVAVFLNASDAGWAATWADLSAGSRKSC